MAAMKASSATVVSLDTGVQKQPVPGTSDGNPNMKRLKITARKSTHSGKSLVARQMLQNLASQPLPVSVEGLPSTSKVTHAGIPPSSSSDNFSRAKKTMPKSSKERPEGTRARKTAKWVTNRTFPVSCRKQEEMFRGGVSVISEKKSPSEVPLRKAKEVRKTNSMTTDKSFYLRCKEQEDEVLSKYRTLVAAAEISQPNDVGTSSPKNPKKVSPFRISPKLTDGSDRKEPRFELRVVLEPLPKEYQHLVTSAKKPPSSTSPTKRVESPEKKPKAETPSLETPAKAPDAPPLGKRMSTSIYAIGRRQVGHPSAHIKAETSPKEHSGRVKKSLATSPKTAFTSPKNTVASPSQSQQGQSGQGTSLDILSLSPKIHVYPTSITEAASSTAFTSLKYVSTSKSQSEDEGFASVTTPPKTEQGPAPSGATKSPKQFAVMPFRTTFTSPKKALTPFASPTRTVTSPGQTLQRGASSPPFSSPTRMNTSPIQSPSQSKDNAFAKFHVTKKRVTSPGQSANRASGAISSEDSDDQSVSPSLKRAGTSVDVNTCKKTKQLDNDLSAEPPSKTDTPKRNIFDTLQRDLFCMGQKTTHVKEEQQLNKRKIADGDFKEEDVTRNKKTCTYRTDKAESMTRQILSFPNSGEGNVVSDICMTENSGRLVHNKEDFSAQSSEEDNSCLSFQEAAYGSVEKTRASDRSPPKTLFQVFHHPPSISNSGDEENDIGSDVSNDGCAQFYSSSSCYGKSEQPEKSPEIEKVRPDFDEVDDIIFMSFASSDAIHIHSNVEATARKELGVKHVDFLKDISQYHVLDQRKKDSDGNRPQKASGSQDYRSMRGTHMRIKKYEQMLKTELQKRTSHDTSADLQKSPQVSFNLQHLGVQLKPSEEEISCLSNPAAESNVPPNVIKKPAPPRIPDDVLKALVKILKKPPQNKTQTKETVALDTSGGSMSISDLTSAVKSYSDATGNSIVILQQPDDVAAAQPLPQSKPAEQGVVVGDNLVLRSLESSSNTKKSAFVSDSLEEYLKENEQIASEGEKKSSEKFSHPLLQSSAAGITFKIPTKPASATKIKTLHSVMAKKGINLPAFRSSQAVKRKVSPKKKPRATQGLKSIPRKKNTLKDAKNALISSQALLKKLPKLGGAAEETMQRYTIERQRLEGSTIVHERASVVAPSNAQPFGDSLCYNGGILIKKTSDPCHELITQGTQFKIIHSRLVHQVSDNPVQVVEPSQAKKKKKASKKTKKQKNAGQNIVTANRALAAVSALAVSEHEACNYVTEDGKRIAVKDPQGKKSATKTSKTGSHGQREKSEIQSRFLIEEEVPLPTESDKQPEYDHEAVSGYVKPVRGDWSQPPPCGKEFCRLGCVCASIRKPYDVNKSSDHCKKEECMLECLCFLKEKDQHRSARVKKRPSFFTEGGMVFYDGAGMFSLDYAKNPKLLWQAASSQLSKIADVKKQMKKKSPVSSTGGGSTGSGKNRRSSDKQIGKSESKKERRPGDVPKAKAKASTCARTSVYSYKKRQVCSCHLGDSTGRPKGKKNKCCDVIAPTLQPSKAYSSSAVFSSDRISSLKLVPKTGAVAVPQNRTPVAFSPVTPQGISKLSPGALNQGNVTVQQEPKVIEIVSDCDWQGEKEKILQCIAKHTSMAAIQPEEMRVGRFRIEIVPVKDKDTSVVDRNAQMATVTSCGEAPQLKLPTTHKANGPQVTVAGSSQVRKEALPNQALPVCVHTSRVSSVTATSSVVPVGRSSAVSSAAVDSHATTTINQTPSCQGTTPPIASSNVPVVVPSNVISAATVEAPVNTLSSSPTTSPKSTATSVASSNVVTGEIGASPVAVDSAVTSRNQTSQRATASTVGSPNALPVTVSSDVVVAPVLMQTTSPQATSSGITSSGASSPSVDSATDIMGDTPAVQAVNAAMSNAMPVSVSSHTCSQGVNSDAETSVSKTSNQSSGDQVDKNISSQQEKTPGQRVTFKPHEAKTPTPEGKTQAPVQSAETDADGEQVSKVGTVEASHSPTTSVSEKTSQADHPVTSTSSKPDSPPPSAKTVVNSPKTSASPKSPDKSLAFVGVPHKTVVGKSVLVPVFLSQLELKADEKAVTGVKGETLKKAMRVFNAKGEKITLPAGSAIYIPSKVVGDKQILKPLVISNADPGTTRNEKQLPRVTLIPPPTKTIKAPTLRYDRPGFERISSRKVTKVSLDDTVPKDGAMVYVQSKSDDGLFAVVRAKTNPPVIKLQTGENLASILKVNDAVIFEDLNKNIPKSPTASSVVPAPTVPAVPVGTMGKSLTVSPTTLVSQKVLLTSRAKPFLVTGATTKTVSSVEAPRSSCLSPAQSQNSDSPNTGDKTVSMVSPQPPKVTCVSPTQVDSTTVQVSNSTQPRSPPSDKEVPRSYTESALVSVTTDTVSYAQMETASSMTTTTQITQKAKMMNDATPTVTGVTTGTVVSSPGVPNSAQAEVSESQTSSDTDTPRKSATKSSTVSCSSSAPVTVVGEQISNSVVPSTSDKDSRSLLAESAVVPVTASSTVSSMPKENTGGITKATTPSPEKVITTGGVTRTTATVTTTTTTPSNVALNVPTTSPTTAMCVKQRFNVRRLDVPAASRSNYRPLAPALPPAMVVQLVPVGEPFPMSKLLSAKNKTTPIVLSSAAASPALGGGPTNLLIRPQAESAPVKQQFRISRVPADATGKEKSGPLPDGSLSRSHRVTEGNGNDKNSSQPPAERPTISLKCEEKLGPSDEEFKSTDDEKSGANPNYPFVNTVEVHTMPSSDTEEIIDVESCPVENGSKGSESLRRQNCLAEQDEEIIDVEEYDSNGKQSEKLKQALGANFTPAPGCQIHSYKRKRKSPPPTESDHQWIPPPTKAGLSGQDPRALHNSTQKSSHATKPPSFAHPIGQVARAPGATNSSNGLTLDSSGHHNGKQTWTVVPIAKAGRSDAKGQERKNSDPDCNLPPGELHNFRERERRNFMAEQFKRLKKLLFFNEDKIAKIVVLRESMMEIKMQNDLTGQLAVKRAALLEERKSKHVQLLKHLAQLAADKSVKFDQKMALIESIRHMHGKELHRLKEKEKERLKSKASSDAGGTPQDSPSTEIQDLLSVKIDLGRPFVPDAQRPGTGNPQRAISSQHGAGGEKLTKVLSATSSGENRERKSRSPQSNANRKNKDTDPNSRAGAQTISAMVLREDEGHSPSDCGLEKAKSEAAVHADCVAVSTVMHSPAVDALNAVGSVLDASQEEKIIIISGLPELKDGGVVPAGDGNPAPQTSDENEVAVFESADDSPDPAPSSAGSPTPVPVSLTMSANCMQLATQMLDEPTTRTHLPPSVAGSYDNASSVSRMSCQNTNQESSVLVVDNDGSIKPMNMVTGDDGSANEAGEQIAMETGESESQDGSMIVESDPTVPAATLQEIAEHQLGETVNKLNREARDYGTRVVKMKISVGGDAEPVELSVFVPAGEKLPAPPDGCTEYAISELPKGSSGGDKSDQLSSSTTRKSQHNSRSEQSGVVVVEPGSRDHAPQNLENPADSENSNDSHIIIIDDDGDNVSVSSSLRVQNSPCLPAEAANQDSPRFLYLSDSNDSEQ